MVMLYNINSTKEVPHLWATMAETCVKRGVTADTELYKYAQAF